MNVARTEQVKRTFFPIKLNQLQEADVNSNNNQQQKTTTTTMRNHQGYFKRKKSQQEQIKKLYLELGTRKCGGAADPQYASDQV